MDSKFIELTIGNYIIVHGYDKKNKEIVEEIKVDLPSKKVIAVARIKSLSKKYILTDYIDRRWIYWEYEEDYEKIKKILVK